MIRRKSGNIENNRALTMGRIKGIAIWVALAIGTLPCLGQNLLAFKTSNHRIAYYRTGDVLSFRLKGDKSKISDQITGFEDSLIIFKNYKVKVNEISALYLDKKTRMWYFLKYKYEKILPMAGGVYLLADVINT